MLSRGDLAAAFVVAFSSLSTTLILLNSTFVHVTIYLRYIGFDFIVCGYFTDNAQSKRMQEKCGFKFLKNSKCETAYGITKEECITILYR